MDNITPIPSFNGELPVSTASHSGVRLECNLRILTGRRFTLSASAVVNSLVS